MFFMSNIKKLQKSLIDITKDLTLLFSSLRDKCVYQQAMEKDNINLWFKYSYNFLNTAVKNQNIDDDVAKVIVNKLGMDYEKVKTCIDNSFEKPGDY